MMFLQEALLCLHHGCLQRQLIAHAEIFCGLLSAGFLWVHIVPLAAFPVPTLAAQMWLDSGKHFLEVLAEDLKGEGLENLSTELLGLVVLSCLAAHLAGSQRSFPPDFDSHRIVSVGKAL